MPPNLAPDKRGPRVDLHLCFQIGVVGHKIKAEQRVFCIIRSRDSFSFNPVLQIMSFLEKTVLLKVTSRSAGNFCKKSSIYILFNTRQRRPRLTRRRRRRIPGAQEEDHAASTQSVIINPKKRTMNTIS